MMTDPIADLLTRIRNAAAVKKAEIILPFSKIKLEIAKILKKEEMLEEVETIDEPSGFKSLKLILKYSPEGSAIKHIKRVSKPGRRVYVDREHLPYILNDLGFAIISTSRGIMTNKQARRAKIGGELICEVW
jgi:small subunit ribosomal protein S8